MNLIYLFQKYNRDLKFPFWDIYYQSLPTFLKRLFSLSLFIFCWIFCDTVIINVNDTCWVHPVNVLNVFQCQALCQFNPKTTLHARSSQSGLGYLSSDKYTVWNIATVLVTQIQSCVSGSVLSTKKKRVLEESVSFCCKILIPRKGCYKH